MEIKVKRITPIDYPYTIGKLYIDGEYFMVTVEFELIDGSTIKESLVKIDTILNSKIDEFIHYNRFRPFSFTLP